MVALDNRRGGRAFCGLSRPLSRVSDTRSGATGARFALLPPDNSTGNFVKVTQRIPVKILLAQAPDADHPLRPGMSVDAAVSVAE